MVFDKYIAIDWSGAQKTPTDGIQVAEYDPKTKQARLANSPYKNDLGWNTWTREQILGYVESQIDSARVMIGLDFAFAYPYCDQQPGMYFPDQPMSPTNVDTLWHTVDEYCSESSDFYGGEFYLDENSPYKRHYHYRKNNTTYKPDGGNYRYRETDNRARPLANRAPSSVFKCIGQNQVGPGSLAGMRFLRRIREKKLDVKIWPFDTKGIPSDSTLVEIYPRVLVNEAKNTPIKGKHSDTVRGLLTGYGAILTDACEKWSEHERDALVSAAGMGYFAHRKETWQAPTDAAEYEGWIFGVR